MNAPLKVYLGDLTYDTLSVSANSFPLNIGYICSYCVGRFGSRVQFKLFKYINDLETAIRVSPPDILGLSNYCWNRNVGLEMFKILHKRNPNAVACWGGPNFPIDKKSQEEWLNKFSEVDVYIPGEAEVGFSKIVESMLEMQCDFRHEIAKMIIPGCIVRGLDGKLNYSNPMGRINNLDEIPSPYLTGIFDEFFDGKLLPLIQTNRGCPFSCTYCVVGSNLFKKVNKFSVKRVSDEVEYIAKHVPKKIHFLNITDSNFGMIPQDLEICNAIHNIREKYGYPEYIGASTGKNSRINIISAIKRLNGSLALVIALQSMDKQVLINIKRENISVERMMELAPIIKQCGLRTKAELILGLPGDNYQSHMNSLKTLLDAGMDEILVFTCMLLPGSELCTPEGRSKWNFITKFRVIPRNFGILANGKKVIEIEECAVGSDLMTFEEYVELRLFIFMVYATNREIVYEPILYFLKEQGIVLFQLFTSMLKRREEADAALKEVFDKFKQATTNELWDSSEELMAHYQDENEFNKLLNGTEGINVLYSYHTLVTTRYMVEWTEYVCKIALDLLTEKKDFNEEINNQFTEIANYCRGLSHNPLGHDRKFTNPEFDFWYDVKGWLNAKIESSAKQQLNEYKMPSRKRIAFRHTKQQFDFVQDLLTGYHETVDGISKALFTASHIIPARMLWRQPFLASEADAELPIQNFSS